MLIKMEQDRQLLIILDGNNHLCRAYFAIQGLTDPLGRNIGAVFGFFKIILYILDRYVPSHLLITFDSFSKKRKTIYPNYKANRKKEGLEDLYSQIKIAAELVSTLGLASLRLEGYEADDLITNISGKAKNQKLETLIFSSDKDFAQLVTQDSLIRLLRPGFKGETILDWNAVKGKFGIYPDQIAEYLALMGDSSDNIPGVPGIGEKTASNLLRKYGIISEIYKNLDELKPGVQKKLREGRELLDISYLLAKLEIDPSIETPEINSLIFRGFTPGSKESIRKLGFTSLEGRI